MIIAIGLLLLMFFANISLTMLYYIHMYQLNSYQNLSHINWIKSKFVKDIIFRNCWLVIPVAISFSDNLVVFMTGTIISYVLMFTVNKKKVQKKPLVYTGRATRLIITLGILNLIVCILSMKLLNVWQISLLLTAWTMMLPFLVMVAGFINSPIEKSINNKFIKEAKNIISGMPRLTVIGITGSYGKTSTKYFLNKILSVKYNVLMTPGNYNTTLGVVRTIREKLNATHEIFLCEMGARHVNDIKEICDLVNPKYGIISSIGPQHLETFFSIENVIKTKFELADAICEDGAVFLNYNNEYIRNNKTDKNIVTYGFSDEEYVAYDIKVNAKGSTFSVKSKNGECETFRTKLIGRHNVENILGAIAVGNKLGISFDDMVYAIKTLEPVPHRLELVKGNNAMLIDDAYNSNPVGAKAALDTLNCFEGVKILITPGMIELGNRQYECNKEFGKQATEVCDYIVLVGKDQTKAIKDGIEENGFDEKNLFVADSFNEGIKWISELKCDREKFVLIENDLPDNY